MIKTRRLVLTGTHTTPAVELINQLQQDTEFNWKRYYIGRRCNSCTSTQASIESKTIPSLKVKFYSIPCGKFDRRSFFNTIRGIPQIFTGFISAYQILKEIQPWAIVSFGGYVSVPVIFAAWLLGIKSITHEQTKTKSLSTRLSAPFSKFIALSFPLKKRSPKEIVTGNLLRRDIFDSSSKNFNFLKFKIKKYPLIFVTAGNQGSSHLNENIKEILPQLKDTIIIHQCGPNDFNEYKKLEKKYPLYFAYSFIQAKDIGWVFNNSKIIISRAGANTIQEIEALKKNSIIIPLPVSQQNEQLKNALWLHKKYPKNTIIILDKNLNGQILLKNIKRLLKTKNLKSKNEANINLKLLNLLKKL